ncbi:MAG: transporter substrate-binding domain-containing protein [Pseudomonadales bacterium]|nr:transporter substrate-binding domain-containing protein [Pseudomonadales bacterium]
MDIKSNLLRDAFSTERFKFQLLFLFALVVNTLLSPVHAQPILRLTVPDIATKYFHTHDHQGLADKVLKEALGRIGYGLEVVVLPTERSLMMASSGAVDGELIRARAIEQKYPDLIRIPVSIFESDFVTFSYEGIDVSDGWSALKGQSVGVIIGMKMIEENIPEDALVTEVKNIQQLFDMVAKKRVKYAIFMRGIGENFLLSRGIHGVSASEQSLASTSAFTYLNKKNVHLVPKLTKALRKMKQDGTYQIILKNHDQSHLMNKPIEAGHLKK